MIRPSLQIALTPSGSRRLNLTRIQPSMTRLRMAEAMAFCLASVCQAFPVEDVVEDVHLVDLVVGVGKIEEGV